MPHAIARVTSIVSLPYGYTVTLWSAGALVVADHGLPRRADVVLFAIGAVAAFLVLGLVGRPHLAHEVPMRVPSTVVANAFPVLVAVFLAIIPLRWLGKPAAFFVTSFVATAAYLLSVAAVVRRTRSGDRARDGKA
jgi:hypothetical protein